MSSSKLKSPSVIDKNKSIKEPLLTSQKKDSNQKVNDIEKGAKVDKSKKDEKPKDEKV